MPLLQSEGLASKARCASLLARYEAHRVSFQEGESFAKMCSQSAEVYGRLESEWMPRLEQLAEQGAGDVSAHIKRIKEVQALLVEVDAALQKDLHVDYGPAWARREYSLFLLKYRFNLEEVEQLDPALDLGRHKIKPTIGYLEQLEVEAARFLRSQLGSTRNQLAEIQRHLAEARTLRDRLRRTGARRDFLLVKSEIERGCVSLAEEVLEQSLKVNLSQHEPGEAASPSPSPLLGKRSSFAISDLFEAQEQKQGGEQSPTRGPARAERKREAQKYVYTRSGGEDTVRARVEARKHFEEILTGAHEKEPRPGATAIYLGNLGRTQELAASLEKEAFGLRGRIDAGYDTLINRYSGPLVKLQQHPLVAQQLVAGKLNVLKIAKQTPDLIFQEKLDALEARIARKQAGPS